MFVRALAQTLQDVPSGFVANTERRRAWYQDRAHFFPEMMLIGCFAYLEGELHKGWIDKYGEGNRRELYVLRIARNAFVHTSGDLTDLDSYSMKRINGWAGRPKDQRVYVRRFATDLRMGRVRSNRGEEVPPYLEVSRLGVANLNDLAFRRLYVLFNEVMRNAKRLPS